MSHSSSRTPARPSDALAARSGTVVITGAAGGIGAELSKRFCEVGWNVVGVDNDRACLDALSKDLGKTQFVAVPGDVSEPETHDRAAAAVGTPNQPLCWINNAGYNALGAVHEVTRSEYERGLAVNLGGVFWGTASAARLMLRGGAGSIINISSTHALVGFKGFAMYAAAKAGIIGLTRQVAAEFAQQGIRCNAIAPGLIETPAASAFLEQDPDPDALRSSWDELCPVGRWGVPDDVAQVALFLASPESEFMTGQVLVVDGGQTVVARGSHERP